MRKKKSFCILLILCATTVFAEVKTPRLVVQLVIDQLRGDLINQYHHKFGADGFNYLLTHGIDYHDAHHPHANTVTCVGHATIATGSYPALHGIVNNDWYDLETQQQINCVEDKTKAILPTPRTLKKLSGRSPRHLMASTLSDELVLAQKGQAFAISFKDRGAIIMAGHAGKAFWFDRENGGFITSRHYYDSYPQWVSQWNRNYEARDATWNLSAPAATYHYIKAPTLNNHFPGFGRHFPHHLGAPDSPTYYQYLSMTPIADELTADFAINLLQKEQLGIRAGKTDYLSISFSAVDIIGHQFGPNSLESEDNLLRLDKTLAQLLSVIDKQVGLENTLIVLTADHGISDSPTYLAAHQIQDNHLLKLAELQTLIEQTLAQRFHLPAKALQAISFPYIYLDHQLINDHQLSISKVRNHLAETLRHQAGVFQAYPMPLTNPQQDWLSEKVNKMGFPKRSGDLYLVPPLYHALAYSKEQQQVLHGTPWVYDSYVPLLFVNPRFKAQRISRLVSTVDIAPTLAAILSIKYPSATVGQPLAEALEMFEPKKCS